MPSPKKKRKRKEDSSKIVDEATPTKEVEIPISVETTDQTYSSILSPLKKIRDIFWTSSTPSKDDKVF